MDFIFDPSLVLYLPLYELDGASFMSKDAYGHLCTVAGAVWTPRGRSLDTIDDKLSIADHPALSFGNGTTDKPFTILAWVNMTDATSYAIIAKGGAAKYEYLSYCSGDKLMIRTYSGGSGGDFIGRRYDTTITPYEGLWICCAFTYDGSSLVGGFKIYLNGIRVDDTNESGGAYTAMNDYDQPTEIGAVWGTGGYSEGLYGELIMYGRQLSPLEIQNLYLATKWRYR